MRAVIYESPGDWPQVREVPDPACPPHGVLVEVRATGVCRSDWHAWQGHDPTPLPHVPGHEFAGVISEVGTDVCGWQVGDRVTSPFINACGECTLCARGEHQVCERQTQPGFTRWGSFAERVVVDHAAVNLVALPEGMDFTVAASLGCRFATAYRALAVHGRVFAEPDQQVVVLGCGGLGQAAVMIAVAAGAPVVAVDVTETALASASALGAHTVIDAHASDDLVAAIRSATGGGADLTVDALGNADLAATALRSLRGRGRHVQAGLLVGPDADPSLPMGEVISRELRIHGSHGMPAHEYPELLARIASGELDPARLIGQRITLAEAPAALADLPTAGQAGVTMITF